MKWKGYADNTGARHNPVSVTDEITKTTSCEVVKCKCSRNGKNGVTSADEAFTARKREMFSSQTNGGLVWTRGLAIYAFC